MITSQNMKGWLKVTTEVEINLMAAVQGTCNILLLIYRHLVNERLSQQTTAYQ